MATPKNMKTIVALYDSLQSAKRAVDRLHGEDIPDELISVIASARGHGKRKRGTAKLEDPRRSEESGAAVGVCEATPAPGLAPNLVAAGVPETDARAYLEAVRDGGALVMVFVKPRKLAPVARALSNADPVPLSHRNAAPSLPRV